MFKAEIDGEVFDISSVQVPLGRHQMGISDIENHEFLTFYGKIYEESLYPYNQIINLAVFLQNDEVVYSLAKKDTIYYSENAFISSDAYYFEFDGDAFISNYRSIENDDGFITVAMDTLEGGEVVVFGTFEFTVAVVSRTDEFSQRVNQDTLHITNGEYRMLLDDRREK
jgi:hypothetical protein